MRSAQDATRERNQRIRTGSVHRRDFRSEKDEDTHHHDYLNGTGSSSQKFQLQVRVLRY